MEWLSMLYFTLIFIQKPTLGTMVHIYSNRPGCFVTHSLYSLSYEVRLSMEIAATVRAAGLTMEMPTTTGCCIVMTARKSD
jgi:hypothetical protein